jgi:hypothetical protein
LLEKIRASKPDPDHDLRHATHISRLYDNSAAAHRLAGKLEEAEALSKL